MAIPEHAHVVDKQSSVPLAQHLGTPGDLSIPVRNLKDRHAVSL